MLRKSLTSFAAICLCALAPGAAANVDEDAREPASISNESRLDFSAENSHRREATIARGDTLLRILLEHGVGRREAGAAAAALGRVANARALRPGQVVTLFLWPHPRPARGNRLVGFALALRGGTAAVVHRDIDNRFVAHRMPDAEAVALLESILFAPDDEPAGYFGRDVRLGRGDTVSGVLIAAGAAAGDVHAAMRILQRSVDLRRLLPGQTVTALFRREDGAPRLAGVALTTLDGKAHTVGKGEDGRWRPGPPSHADGAEPPSSTVAAAPSDGAAAAPQSPEEQAGHVVRELTLAKGDNLATALASVGAAARDVHAVTTVLRRSVDLRRLLPGQTVTALFRREDGTPRLAGVALTTLDGRAHTVGKGEDGRWRPGPPSQADGAEPPSSTVAAAPQSLGKQAGHVVREFTLAKGDNLATALASVGAAARDVHAVTTVLRRSVDLRRLLPGQTVTALFRREDGTPRLAGVALTTLDGRAHTVGKGEDGRWRPGPPSQADGAEPPSSTVAAAPQSLGKQAGHVVREFTLAKGDNLATALASVGAAARDVHAVTTVLRRSVDLRRLLPGQTVTALFRRGDGTPRLAAVALTTLDGKAHTVGKGEDGRWRPGSAAGANAVELWAATAAVVEAREPAPGAREATVVNQFVFARGDTLALLLRRAGAPARDIDAAARGLRRVYDLKRIREGKRLRVEIDRPAGRARLRAAVLETGRRGGFAVEREAGGRFLARAIVPAEIEAALAAPVVAASAAMSLAARIGDAPLGPVVEEAPHRIEVSRGATLIGLLLDAGFAPADAQAAFEAVEGLYDPRDLRAGEFVEYVHAHVAPGTPPRIGRVHVDIDVRTRLSIVRLGDGSFVAGHVEKALRRDLATARGVIDTNLYQAMTSAEVPPTVIMESMGLLSQGVDLQRDVQDGDAFAVVFETFVDERGKRVDNGDVIHISLVLSGEPRNIYRHVSADGRVGYFDEHGENARKSLMLTPIDGARLTSRFGMRRHPISGYTRQHKGIDFGAPSGTPIYAAGDGVVERASRFGAYGRYVRIRHSNLYKTAYAHLSAYAEGIFPGKRVRQGETIGYVGSSGRSTGPHLHYEVIYNGRQVNPLSVELPSGDPIGDSERAAFDETLSLVERVLQSAPAVSSVAAGGPAANRPSAVDPFYPIRLP